MAQENETGLRGYTAGADLEAYRRVKLDSSGNIVYAGVDETGIGTVMASPYGTNKSGETATVKEWNFPGTRRMVCAGAVAAYAVLYGAANGKVDDDTSGGPAIGVALAAGSGDGSVIEVELLHSAARGSRLLFANKADSSAGGAGSNAEFNFDVSASIPAGAILEDDVLEIDALVKCPATHSTDTFTSKLKVATEVIAQSAATDVANNDLVHIHALVTVRAAGAGGKLEASGTVAVGASGTGAEKVFSMAEQAEDLSGAVAITVTGQYSVADAGNSAVLQKLVVIRHRK